MTQYLAIRSAASGPALVGTVQDQVPLWDVTQQKWYVGTAPGGGAVDSVFGRIGVVVAVTSDYDSDQVDNVSGVTGASVSDALDYLLANAGAVASVYGRVGAVVAVAGDYDSDQVDNLSSVTGAFVSDALDALLAAIPTAATSLTVSASPRLLGRFGVGAGAVEEGALGGGLEVNAGLTAPQVASQLPARTTENVVIDLYPSIVQQGAINNAASVDVDFAVAAGKRYTITASVWVDDGAAGACLYMKELRVIAHQTSGAAVDVTNIVSAAPLESLGFTFVAAASTTNIRFTLANASGSNRTYNIAVGAWAMDTP